MVSGSLPTGLSLSTAGVITGVPTTAGDYSATARVTSGAQTANATLAISVTEPAVLLANALGQLLSTSGTLTADEVGYLDYIGNKNGGYDLGDFLAWVKRTNATPAAPAVAGRKGTVLP